MFMESRLKLGFSNVLSIASGLKYLLQIKPSEFRTRIDENKWISWARLCSEQPERKEDKIQREGGREEKWPSVERVLVPLLIRLGVALWFG